MERCGLRLRCLLGFRFGKKYCTLRIYLQKLRKNGDFTLKYITWTLQPSELQSWVKIKRKLNFDVAMHMMCLWNYISLASSRINYFLKPIRMFAVNINWLQWLSLLHNFIQQSMKSGSAQIQILLAMCQRFEMTRICNNGPCWQ